MTNKQRLILHKYRDLKKEEIVKTISKIIRINDQILFNSSVFELCEYLNKLEKIFGKIKNAK